MMRVVVVMMSVRVGRLIGGSSSHGYLHLLLTLQSLLGIFLTCKSTHRSTHRNQDLCDSVIRFRCHPFQLVRTNILQCTHTHTASPSPASLSLARPPAPSSRPLTLIESVESSPDASCAGFAHATPHSLIISSGSIIVVGTDHYRVNVDLGTFFVP